MTTDPFTTAARAESERLAPTPEDGERFHVWNTRDMRDHAEEMAEWARDHLAAQEPTGLDDAETYRKIAAEIEWHIRTASARGYARAKGADLPDGVIDAQIESAVRAITTIAARTAQRDEETR